MKIAHVVYDLQMGGVSNIVTSLLKTARPGIEQMLILLTDRKDPLLAIPETIKKYSLGYRPIEEYSLQAFARFAFLPQKYYGNIASQVEEIYDKERFDIYHYHGLPQDMPVGSLLKKKQPHVKLVYTDHMLRISRQEYKKLSGKLLARIYRKFYKDYNCIFVSDQSYEAAKKYRFVNETKHNAAIENSIDISRFSQKKDFSIPGRPTIVYVSRISAVKGHLLLVKVALLLKEKYHINDFEFVLIGPGELTEELKKEIANQSLSGHFNLLGPRYDVAELLPGYDMGVFPSEREGLPVSLIEKMAAGLPVVASDIPEIKNVIRGADEALLFPVNDAEACAEQLSRLINDKNLREITGAAARKAIEDRYSSPLLEKYIEFYKQTL